MQIGWVDFSEKERRIVHELIRAMQNPETRDELGIGRIRDFFSELFFPGTSLIQTRARYFLFIPWIFQRLENERTRTADIDRKTRDRESQLIEALRAGGESTGIIGGSAGRALQRMPSDIYWPAMAKWDIFRAGHDRYVSRGMYYGSLDDIYKRRKSEARDEADELVYGESLDTWHPSLPDAPHDLMTTTGFALERAEAEFLKERIQQNCAGTLIEFLILNKIGGLESISYLWDLGTKLPTQLAEQVDCAERFSLLMHGAAIFYNICVARLIEQGRDAEFHSDLEHWFQAYHQMVGSRGDWEPGELASMGLLINSRTRRFLSEWHETVSRLGEWHELISKDHPAARLIESREVSLKGKRARLISQEARDQWSGASGLSRLDYRWRVAKVIVSDIIKGLERNA